jgi:hypothetical protein
MNQYRKTAIELLEKFNLNFEIIKVPLVGVTENENIPTNYYGLLNTKTNEIIHTVKKSYMPTQNVDTLTAILMAIEGTDIKINKAFNINNGRKVIYQLELGTKKFFNDNLTQYITITDSNDGRALCIGFGNKTISCQNQFYSFQRQSNIKIYHSQKYSSYKNIILNEIMKMKVGGDNIIRKFQKMKLTPVSQTHIDKMINTLIPTNENEKISTRKLNMIESLNHSIKNQIKDKGLNLWGLFSGVTHWTTHVKSCPKRENGRIESVVLGNNKTTNLKAFSLVEELMMS